MLDITDKSIKLQKNNQKNIKNRVDFNFFLNYIV